MKTVNELITIIRSARVVLVWVGALEILVQVNKRDLIDQLKQNYELTTVLSVDAAFQPNGELHIDTSF